MTDTILSSIHLIFTSNPSLIKESDIRKPLYTDSCHHSIGLGKMNLNDPLPIRYKCEVKKNIHRRIRTCNWKR